MHQPNLVDMPVEVWADILEEQREDCSSLRAWLDFGVMTSGSGSGSVYGFDFGSGSVYGFDFGSGSVYVYDFDFGSGSGSVYGSGYVFGFGDGHGYGSSDS